MTFLDKETELLLEECIENSSDYPRILAEKFKGLSAIDDKRLRNRIRTLIEDGYISKLQWADNVPWFGTITEKGYSYFHDKDVFIRAKLRKENGFNLLDEECEGTLRQLQEEGGDLLSIDGPAEKAKVYEHLARLGYISFGKQGVSYSLDRRFHAIISLTQLGKTYFSDKEKLIEEILVLGTEESDAIENNNIETPRRATEKRVHPINSENTMITFSGILGFDCGEVEEYDGADKQLQEKGYLVRNGIPTLRGFAKISDLAKASKAKYEEYQRDRNQSHVDEIATFLEKGKAEAKFLPEVVLSINATENARLTKYSHRSFSAANATIRGAIDNMDYYVLSVEEGALSRVDGNHRLEAGKDEDYYVPFSIIVWGIDLDNEDNLLSAGNEESNTESEAFLFYILNNTAKKLEAEENFKGLVKSETWTKDELALIDKQLPLLQFFDKTYANSPLLDRSYLHAPLSQICDVLRDINDPDLGEGEFAILFPDTMKLLGQTGVFEYCHNTFCNIMFQLAFYTRYKSDNYEMALNNLRLVNNWLQKYKYTGDTFTKASKIYDVAYRFITSSPKTIFMAMEYRSKERVDDYNGALKRAVQTINNLDGNIEVQAYPIMTGKGKSINFINDIFKKIEDCSIFIADITENNPNVMYELGMAISRKKPTIILRAKGKKGSKRRQVPTDLSVDFNYEFSGMESLESTLVEHIKDILINEYGAVFSGQ